MRPIDGVPGSEQDSTDPRLEAYVSDLRVGVPPDLVDASPALQAAVEALAAAQLADERRSTYACAEDGAAAAVSTASMGADGPGVSAAAAFGASGAATTGRGPRVCGVGGGDDDDDDDVATLHNPTAAGLGGDDTGEEDTGDGSECAATADAADPAFSLVARLAGRDAVRAVNSDATMLAATPAIMSQVPTAHDDFESDLPELFPQGATDAAGQQLDMRKHNSWNMTLAQLPPAEAHETMTINALAPMVLTARLKTLMEAAPPAGNPSRGLGPPSSPVQRLRRAVNPDQVFRAALKHRREATFDTARPRGAAESSSSVLRQLAFLDHVPSSTVSALLGWSYLVGRTQGDSDPPSGAGLGKEACPPADEPWQKGEDSPASPSGPGELHVDSLGRSASREGMGEVGADGLHDPAWVLRPDRSVVQVSGREGFFSSSFKDSVHPHTNAAKAALHMLVKTAAPEFAAARIFMNVVDTGWISTMHPTHKAAEVEQSVGFVTPLDSVDGAARILDPWFSSIEAQASAGALDAPPWGMVIKDFRYHGW